jgi:hypothetical protein
MERAGERRLFVLGIILRGSRIERCLGVDTLDDDLLDRPHQSVGELREIGGQDLDPTLGAGIGAPAADLLAACRS